MPIWLWIIAAVVAVSFVGAVVFLLSPDRRKERLLREGTTVVARIMMASPSLYDAADRTPFGFAHVVFTLDSDCSAEHLAFLESVGQRLTECETARQTDADERLIAKAVTQETTVGPIPLRIPERLAGRRAVYFATPSVMRRFFPDGCLSRDYIYLKVIVDDEGRSMMMIEDPPRSRPAAQRGIQ